MQRSAKYAAAKTTRLTGDWTPTDASINEIIRNSTVSVRKRIRQLVRDRRTIGLLVIMPLVIASLVGVSIPEKSILDYVAPAILATLILFFGFLLTGISFLRERS